MTALRAFFLVFALFFAQLAAGAHAVEHAAGKEGALPAHVCELCLAAHDLGSALPGVAALPPAVAAVLVPESLSSVSRGQLPPPCATQRGPPVS